MADKRINLGKITEMEAAFLSMIASVGASRIIAASVIEVIEWRHKIEIKNKVKFILYLSTNYPKRNYSRVCKRMEGKGVKEWKVLLDSYKKKYKVRV